MKITVLVDNNTLIDRYFQAEPGLSLLIESDGRKILFDCGYSDLVVRNAQKMGISLADIDMIVLSHGHLDHTWGLDALIRHFTEHTLEKRPCSRPTLIAHPETLRSIEADDCPEIGPLLDRTKLARHFTLQLTSSPLALTPSLLFLGEISRHHPFEGQTAIGTKEGTPKADLLPDDSALVYNGPEGLVIITGCSHSGICNIVDYAIKTTGESRIRDIIGGLHLLDAEETTLQGTVDFLRHHAVKEIHPCHCTDLNAKIRLAEAVPVREVGVGLSLTY